MKLPDAANYGWSTVVDDDARTYTIEGQTDRSSDCSIVSMPLVGAMRRRAGTSSAASGNLSNLIFKGDEKYVVQVDSKWLTATEIAAIADANSAPRGMDPRMGGWGMGMRRGRRGLGDFPPLSPPPTPASDQGEKDGESVAKTTQRKPYTYSNLQKTLSRPHEEIGIIVAGASELKLADDILSGTLSETAAKLLLVHPGQKELTPLKATGTFRAWVKDGVLVKYEVKLEGTLAVQTNGGRREVEVHQTALTEIKNVGTTKFDLPDEAKKKLGA